MRQRLTTFRSAALAAALVALAAACATAPRTGTTTTTSASPPSHRTSASPAEAWSTGGGPASPGAPSNGSVVDPGIEHIHDGGVW